MNSLCKKIEMYIDQENYLPLYQKLFDGEGLMGNVRVHEFENQPNVQGRKSLLRTTVGMTSNV